MASTSPVYDPETEGEQGYHPQNPDPLDNSPAGNPSDPTAPPGPSPYDPYDPYGEAGDSTDPYGNEPAGDPSDPRGEGSDNLDYPDDLDNLRNGEAGNQAGSQGPTDGAPLTPTALRNSEGEASSGFASGFGTQQGKGRGGAGQSGLTKFLKKHRKKIITGGMLGGGITGLIVSLVITLVPLKIENMVQNLQSRFFSASEGAITRMTRNSMEKYLTKYALPAYKNCSLDTSIDKSCKVKIVTGRDNPVTQMYKSFSQAKMERKLAKQGIYFRFNTKSHTWHIITPVRDANGNREIGPNGEKLSQMFATSSSHEVKDIVDNAIEDITGKQKTLYRFRVGGLLSSRYSVTRCLIYCGPITKLKSEFSKNKREALKAAKLLITQRVITPQNQTLGLALECLFSDCDPSSTQPSNPDDANGQNGFPEADIDSTNRKALEKLAARVPGTNLEELQKTYDKIAEQGFQEYVLKAVLGDALGEFTTKAIPVVGWMNAAAKAIDAAHNAAPAIKKLVWVINSGAAVKLYMMYRSYADEIHTGNANDVEVGSFVNSLGAGNEGAANDPIKGGTAGAEDTPLYNSLMGENQAPASTAGSLISSLLPARAFAASTDTTASDHNNVKCDDGNGIPSGQLVCNEEVLGGGNHIANAVGEALDQPATKPVVTIAHAWKTTVDKVVTGVTEKPLELVAKVADPFCKLPVAPPPYNSYCDAKKLVSKASGAIMDLITSTVLPNPFSTNMSGGRIFDMMAAGADVAGNEFAHISMGASRVTDAVAAQQRQQYETDERRRFAMRSFSERMFDTDSQYSLTTQVAMSMPLNLQTSATTGFAHMLSNPLELLDRSFGSLFGARARAESTKDAFNVPQYVLLNIPADPEDYWDKHCSENEAQAYQNDADYKAHSWSKEATEHTDAENGMPSNDTENPCAAIKTMTAAAGGRFDKTLIPENDRKQAGEDQQAAVTEDSGGSGSLPSGSSQDLAKQLLPFIKQGKIVCGSAAGGSGPANCADIQNSANGHKLGGNCKVDALKPHLLGLILALVKDKNWKLGLSAVCSNHHPEGDGPYAGHSYGSTADFSIENGASGASAASNKKFVDDVAALLSETGGSFGQVQCHNGPYPSQKNKKFTTFNDACNHQHVRAEN